MNENVQIFGNVGCYVDERNIISFQMGEMVNFSANNTLESGYSADNIYASDIQNFLSIKGFNVAFRGVDNMKCEQVERDLKKNRLLPKLISKQISMLYGSGPSVYKKSIIGGKITKSWVDVPEIMEWLESWEQYGLESYTSFAKASIKNFYYHSDFFVKWRMLLGNRIGRFPVAGLESLETRHCRLATTKKDVITELIRYSDFTHVCVGKWNYGTSSYLFYPRITVANYRNVNYAGISHHRQKSVNEFYGLNETHEGSRPYITGSNDTAGYINSFLKNSLAAKIHIIIPNQWCEAKRNQISSICSENKKRKANGDVLLKFNRLDVGTEFKESTFIEYLNSELRKVSEYLSGADNQGKAYATISFKSSTGDVESWKFESVDLKYKEYIESLISYDKRADEALLSSVGMDSSISSVSKEGVISKSGADVYYNYLIYLFMLNPDDEICSEPFNMAIKINFPELYKQGYRIGFYREIPSRQEEIAPNDRLNKQQS